MLIAQSRMRKHSTVDEIPARGNGIPALATSETSASCYLTLHVFLQRKRLVGMEN